MTLARALIAEIAADPEALAELRAVLDLDRPAADESDRWMDSRQAADYLGRSRQAIYELTAARSIPFEQECRGGKLWFRRPELDAWMRGERRCRDAAALP